MKRTVRSPVPSQEVFRRNGTKLKQGLWDLASPSAGLAEIPGSDSRCLA
jgi:hypothetical protein